MTPAEDITLRPAAPNDRSFLRQVYRESRAEELAATGWTEAQKAAFCASQFAAQDHYYRTQCPDCEFLIIERGGHPIGRLYRDRQPAEIRVVDIALLPAERNRGVGGGIMRDIIAEAEREGLTVRIYVERDNPARHLYKRLGFELHESGDVYDLLIWKTPF